MRQRLNLCIRQITSKSVGLKQRLKIKLLFNDIRCTLELGHIFSEPLQHDHYLNCVEFKRMIVTGKSPLFSGVVTF